jgi:hypothetical protein
VIRQKQNGIRALSMVLRTIAVANITACETTKAEMLCSVRYMTEAMLDDGSKRTRYDSAQIGSDGSWNGERC